MSSPHAHVFVTTRWTQVLAARGDSDAARSALSELCSAYYAPVLAFLTHTGVGEEDARDVAHEFFARLLSRDELAGADRNRGRFRSYLLGALKHFVANRRLHAAREKRGGAVDHQPLAGDQDTTVECRALSESPQLDALFDHEWAVTVVEGALATLEREAQESDGGGQFEVLKPWLSFAAEPGPQSAAATRLGISEGAVKVAIHRLRHRFRELVRAEVSHTLPPGESVDEELQHLIVSLGIPA